MTARNRHHQERRLRIRSVRKDPPDLRKLASALVALAIAQNEAEAQTHHQKNAGNPPSDQPGQSAKSSHEGPA